MGSVPLNVLVLSDDDTPITELMEQDPVAVSVNTGREDAARLIARHDLLALPVVDENNVLLGVVTHDDATDAMQAETTEDFQKISTVVPFAENMRQASIRLL